MQEAQRILWKWPKLHLTDHYWWLTKQHSTHSKSSSLTPKKKHAKFRTSKNNVKLLFVQALSINNLWTRWWMDNSIVMLWSGFENKFNENVLRCGPIKNEYCIMTSLLKKTSEFQELWVAPHIYSKNQYHNTSSISRAKWPT